VSENKLTYPEVIMIYVDGEDKKHFKYSPTQDITPWESAKLVELYAYVVATKKQCDWWSFVVDNNLERHFTETEIKDE
jgi:hypothetical protein